MTPLERAAQAIETDLERQQREHQCNLEVIDGRLDTKALARAVLTAIREPSEGMVSIGLKRENYVRGCAAMYTAMIDAMLAEGDEDDGGTYEAAGPDGDLTPRVIAEEG